MPPSHHVYFDSYMWEELLRRSLAGPTLITSEAVRLRMESVLILRDGMGGMNLVVLLANNGEDWFFLSAMR